MRLNDLSIALYIQISEIVTVGHRYFLSLFERIVDTDQGFENLLIVTEHLFLEIEVLSLMQI